MVLKQIRITVKFIRGSFGRIWNMESGNKYLEMVLIMKVITEMESKIEEVAEIQKEVSSLGAGKFESISWPKVGDSLEGPGAKKAKVSFGGVGASH